MRINLTTDKNPLHESDIPCYQTVMLVGPPGVGKGTQGTLLAEIPGIFHVSSGDMFRELDITSEHGQIFQEHERVGKLVPDYITVGIWQDYMATKVQQTIYSPETDLLILDGIPRNILQADLIAPYIKLLKVIYMVCEDKEVMVKRIRRRAIEEHRLDDAEEMVVRYRLDIYKEQTEPLIDYYPQDLIRIIDADTIAADVLHQILSTIVPIQQKYFKPPIM